MAALGVTLCDGYLLYTCVGLASNPIDKSKGCVRVSLLLK